MAQSEFSLTSCITIHYKNHLSTSVAGKQNPGYLRMKQSISMIGVFATVQPCHARIPKDRSLASLKTVKAMQTDNQCTDSQ